MRKAGMTANVVSFITAISAWEKRSRWDRALALLHRMRETGMTADVMSFNVAWSSCEKAEQWEQAVVLRYFTDA